MLNGMMSECANSGDRIPELDQLRLPPTLAIPQQCTHASEGIVSNPFLTDETAGVSVPVGIAFPALF